jgi:hypothetical protein
VRGTQPLPRVEGASLAAQSRPYSNWARACSISSPVRPSRVTASAYAAAAAGPLAHQDPGPRLDTVCPNTSLDGDAVLDEMHGLAGLINLTAICKMVDSATGAATCSGVYRDASSTFGGAHSLTVTQMLSEAASHATACGGTWYNNVKSTQELAKDAFDAVNNEAALAP